MSHGRVELPGRNAVAARLRPPAARLLVALALGACIASAAPAQGLYWVDTQWGAAQLGRSDASGGAISSLALPPGSLPEGLAYEPFSGTLFWGEASWSGARLMRSHGDFTSVVAIVTGGSSLRGVAVNGPLGKVYWCTSNQVIGGQILRANLDGSSVEAIQHLAPGVNPRGLSLDPLQNWVYWTDFSGDMLYRCPLEGGAIQYAGPYPGARPYGITIVPATQELYWAAYGTGQIFRLRLESGITEVPFTGLVNPTWIAVDELAGTIYWSEAGGPGAHVTRANLDGSGITPLPLPVSAFGGLAASPTGGAAVDDEDVTDPVEALAFLPPSPNPARDRARLRFALPRATPVRLDVLDLEGRRVERVLDGVVAAGRHAIEWDTTGRPAGIYFVRFEAEGRRWMSRLAIVR